VWNDRGGSPAQVLGPRFWQSQPGCSWLVSPSATPPDFAAQAKDPANGASLPEGQAYSGPRQLRFDGYSLNKDGLPTFRYRLRAALDDAVAVEDFPEPGRSASGVGIKRHFTLEVPAEMNPWLWAGEGSTEPRIVDSEAKPVAVDWKSGSVELPAKDRLVILPQEGGRTLVFRVPDALDKWTWNIKRVDGKWQVVLGLPRTSEAGKLKVRLDTWSIYRDDQAFIKELLTAK
jgi:hypothetical protein